MLDPFVSYCFDVAVTRWGSAFEAALTAASKGKNDARAADRAVEQTVRKWLKTPRQPVGTTGRTMSF